MSASNPCFWCDLPACGGTCTSHHLSSLWCGPVSYVDVRMASTFIPLPVSGGQDLRACIKTNISSGRIGKNYRTAIQIFRYDDLQYKVPRAPTRTWRCVALHLHEGWYAVDGIGASNSHDAMRASIPDIKCRFMRLRARADR